MTDKPVDSGRLLPSFKTVMTTALFLTIVGWGGLVLLFILTLPTLGPRWLLFFLTTLAFSGPVLPLMHYLHRRFPSRPPANSAIIVREALWVGIFADTVIWLQFGKVLNFALAILIAVGLVMIEVLIRLRERSKWSPSSAENE